MPQNKMMPGSMAQNGMSSSASLPTGNATDPPGPGWGLVKPPPRPESGSGRSGAGFGADRPAWGIVVRSVMDLARLPVSRAWLTRITSLATSRTSIQNWRLFSNLMRSEYGKSAVRRSRAAFTEKPTVAPWMHSRPFDSMR